MLHCLCSYVFDGNPPDMKKQELAKRHDIFEYFFHYSYVIWHTYIISVLQSLLSLLECTIIFRYSKREDATEDLKEAVEVIVLLQVCSLFGIIIMSILLFLNPKGKWSLMFQDGDKDAIEKLSKRTVKVISSFCKH